MRQKRGSSPYKKLLLFLIAIAALLGGYYWGNQYAVQTTDYLNLHPLASPVTIKAVNLTHYGTQQRFSEKNFQGKWSLVLVGHHDLAISNDQLTLAVQIYNRLADKPDLQDSVQVIFLELDTNAIPAQAINYVRRYHPGFIAIGGDRTEVESLTRQIGATYKITTKGTDPQQIDHSTSMALITPTAQLAGVFTGRVDAVSISADIKTLDRER